MSIAIASAPVNFGVYGGVTTDGVDRDALLAAVAAAGYSGMELGPPGFLGAPAEVAARFRRHGLSVAGAYVPLHLSGDRAALEQDLRAMARTLAELSATAAAGDRPIAILADEGAPELLAHPARRWDDRSLALDDAGWDRLADGLARAQEIARAAGIRTAFHPHIATYVESPWEIDRLLSRSDIDLALDTGHVRLAGGDPVALLGRYRDRVGHVHLKDVRVAVLERARDQRRTDFDAWWPDACVSLGSGDASVAAFLATLVGGGYDGWIVVEQDHPPLGRASLAAALDADARNARWLRDRLAELATPVPAGMGPDA